jgi:hypothetical protein
MTNVSLLRWISPRTGFVAITALTGLCLAATIVFALLSTMSSFVLAWAVLTAILAGSSVYAWWDWKHPPKGPNPPVR